MPAMADAGDPGRYGLRLGSPAPTSSGTPAAGTSPGGVDGVSGAGGVRDASVDGVSLSRGRRTRKVAPSPGAVSSSTEPPWAAVMAATSECFRSYR